MMKKLMGALVACLTSIGGAQAAIIERTSELDLAALALPTSDLLTNIAVAPFSLDVGDSLVFHLEFVGGRLVIKDSAVNLIDYIGLQFLSNPAGQTGYLFTGQWHFENVIGELLANDITYSYGGPIGGFTSNTNITDTSFSMSGLTYTVNVTYKEIGRPPFTADSVQFRVFTGGRPADAITMQSVSEPSSVLLMLAAIFGLMVARAGRLTLTQ
jgi:hypothetical protein